MTTTTKKTEKAIESKATSKAKPQHIVDAERAAAAADRRRETLSEVSTSSSRKCPRKKLRELHCPNSFGKYETRKHQGRDVRVMIENPELHCFFTDGSTQTRNRKINEGCTPVTFEGEPVMEGSDVMWSMPYEFHQSETQIAANESNARLRASTDDAEKSDRVSVEATIESGMGE
jgi:hypothetical protein